jgi:hypothetical protein
VCGIAVADRLVGGVLLERGDHMIGFVGVGS